MGSEAHEFANLYRLNDIPHTEPPSNPPTFGLSVPTSFGYAPANFSDADDERPMSAYFDFGTAHTSTPYTTTINNIVDRHVHEIKQVTPPPTTANQWKRRFREFLHTHANDMLEFAAKPLAKHPTLGPAELLLRKFSRSNFSANHASLRDIALDASGVNIVAEIEEALKKFEPTLKGFQEQSRYLFDMFRDAGGEILHNNSILMSRIAVFDRIQAKIISLLEGEMNEYFPPLAEATETYLKKIFEDNGIEEAYKNVIEAYRKFFLLKDIVSLRRLSDSSLNEPLCNICFQEAVQYALSPCGHTYCGTCIKKQLSQCYICRGAVRERVKLFFG